MSRPTWHSTWCSATDGSVDVELDPDASSEVASLSSLPLQLMRPASDATMPCHVSLQWSPQPLRCFQLQLEVQCSARHVEIYANGWRRNMLGEEEQSDVYLGTIRGTKLCPEAHQPFTMAKLFKQSDRHCDLFKRLHSLTLKFVAISGEKHLLKLQHLHCAFRRMDAIPRASSTLAASMAKVDLENVSSGQGGLESFRQMLEREIDTKVAQAIDTKLLTLSQRLANSEQALFELRKAMDSKDAKVEASLAQIQGNFQRLEDQLTQFMVVEDNTKEREGTKNVTSDSAIAGAVKTLIIAAK